MKTPSSVRFAFLRNFLSWYIRLINEMKVLMNNKVSSQNKMSMGLGLVFKLFTQKKKCKRKHLLLKGSFRNICFHWINFRLQTRLIKNKKKRKLYLCTSLFSFLLYFCKRWRLSIFFLASIDLYPNEHFYSIMNRWFIRMKNSFYPIMKLENNINSEINIIYCRLPKLESWEKWK